MAKPFNLEAALAGKPLMTRVGKKARLICSDRKGSNTPLVFLIEEDGNESLATRTIEGRVSLEFQSDGDVLMAPVIQEKWINIYRNGAGAPYPGNCFYSSEEATVDAKRNPDYVATTKVEWFE